MSDLRIGVIGSSGRGRLAKQAHKPGEGSRIVACCDVNPKALEENKEAYGADIFTTSDYQMLLQQPLDAVFVCSPDFLHEAHAAAALERGLGVYLEKPMAITVAGCDRLLTVARENKARLFVGHNMRYMAIIRKMKQLIDDGRIGNVKTIWCRHFISYGGDAYFCDWHSERAKSTGLLLQKGAHDIDVMHWLVGGYTRRVAAFGRLSVYGDLPRREGEQQPVKFQPERWPPKSLGGFSPVIDVEDVNVVSMEMDGGVIGAYLQCHFTPDCCRNYTVIGDEGRLENLGDKPDSPIMIWDKRRDAYRIIGDEVAYGEAPASTEGHGGSDGLIVDEFLNYVRNGGPITATPEAARMAVVAGCLATDSLRDGGKPRDIPPLPY